MARAHADEIRGTNEILNSLLQQMTSIINSSLTTNIEQYEDLKRLQEGGGEQAGTPVGAIM